MENIEAPIATEESTTVTPKVTEETSTTVTEIEPTPLVNGESTTTPVTTEETTTATETVEEKEEIVPPTDEQENVTDTNTNLPPTSLSPGRANIPLKEVNESEKEEPALLPNGTENGMSKKRELEHEEESSEETNNDNDDRNGLDQSKKIKISESTDTPIIETKEADNNGIVVNGNTAVEV